MDNLLSVKNLSRHFIIKNNPIAKSRRIDAVKNVSFDISAGESFGLIGESGCGKTTTANIILRLLKASSGQVFFMGEDITYLDERAMRLLRKDIQVVFQQSAGVLDPKMTIAEVMTEPLRIHKIVSESDFDDEINRLLGLVGLTPSEKSKFPYQLSGGQIQRVIIARALAVKPKLLILDEPVASLDVSVQGQILNLLQSLKKELDLTYLFITHDLKVVRHICSRISVMYKGEIVESNPTQVLFSAPEHEYTKHLLASIL